MIRSEVQLELAGLRERIEDEERRTRLFPGADVEGQDTRRLALEEEEGRLLASLVWTGSTKGE